MRAEVLSGFSAPPGIETAISTPGFLFSCLNYLYYIMI